MSDDLSGGVVRFPKARRRSWRRDGVIDVADRDKLIWAICPYLRDLEPCRGCPEWENDPDHGLFMRGCRGLAREVLNICQTGHPHRRETSDAQS